MHPKIFTVNTQYRKVDTISFLMIPILLSCGGGCTRGDAGPRPIRLRLRMQFRAQVSISDSGMVIIKILRMFLY